VSDDEREVFCIGRAYQAKIFDLHQEEAGGSLGILVKHLER
jgi:hypothetical protein